MLNLIVASTCFIRDDDDDDDDDYDDDGDDGDDEDDDGDDDDHGSHIHLQPFRNSGGEQRQGCTEPLSNKGMANPMDFPLTGWEATSELGSWDLGFITFV